MLREVSVSRLGEEKQSYEKILKSLPFLIPNVSYGMLTILQDPLAQHVLTPNSSHRTVLSTTFGDLRKAPRSLERFMGRSDPHLWVQAKLVIHNELGSMVMSPRGWCYHPGGGGT